MVMPPFLQYITKTEENQGYIQSFWPGFTVILQFGRGKGIMEKIPEKEK
jgi:hypothetical protein